MNLIQADSLCIPLKRKSVQTVVTSPPYFGLRQYGDSRLEVGRDSLPDYVYDLAQTSEQIWEALKDDGVFWLNISDTASGSGGAGGDYNKGGRKEGNNGFKQGSTKGVPKGSWCLVPHRVALELVTYGWRLRSTIVWDKLQLRPEDINHVRRPLLQYEYIFMFTKTMKYKFYPDRLPTRGDVWTFHPKKGKSGSPAPFPEELPKRCILSSSDPGDIILDPFAGSNTTAKVAEENGRIGIGLELYGKSFISGKS